MGFWILKLVSNHTYKRACSPNNNQSEWLYRTDGIVQSVFKVWPEERRNRVFNDRRASTVRIVFGIDQRHAFDRRNSGVVPRRRSRKYHIRRPERGNIKT